MSKTHHPVKQVITLISQTRKLRLREVEYLLKSQSLLSQGSIPSRHLPPSTSLWCLPYLEAWCTCSGELNVCHQSKTVLVRSPEKGPECQLSPFLRGPGRAPASGSSFSRQKTQWPTLQDSQKQPLSQRLQRQSLWLKSQEGSEPVECDRCPLWTKSQTWKTTGPKSPTQHSPADTFHMWNFSLESLKSSL